MSEEIIDPSLETVVETPIEEVPLEIADPDFGPEEDPVISRLDSLERKLTPTPTSTSTKAPVATAEDESIERLYQHFKGRLTAEQQQVMHHQQQDEIRLQSVDNAKAKYLLHIKDALDKSGIDTENSNFLSEHASSTLDSLILRVIRAPGNNGYIDANDIEYIAKAHWPEFKKRLTNYIDKPLIIKKAPNVGGAGSATITASGTPKATNDLERLQQDYESRKNKMSRVEKFQFINKIKALQTQR